MLNLYLKAFAGIFYKFRFFAIDNKDPRRKLCLTFSNIQKYPAQTLVLIADDPSLLGVKQFFPDFVWQINN